MNELSQRLSLVINLHYSLLKDITDQQSALKINPKKWSKKEILGHLIDSASNNHKRFVLAQNMNKLVFEGYDQDLWVHTQNYQESDWFTLIELWFNYNVLIAHLISNISEATLLKQHKLHNLDRVAFKTLSSSVPATLSYFIEDYIDHLEHHLKQIFNQL